MDIGGQGPTKSGKKRRGRPPENGRALFDRVEREKLRLIQDSPPWYTRAANALLRSVREDALTHPLPDSVLRVIDRLGEIDPRRPKTKAIRNVAGEPPHRAVETLKQGLRRFRRSHKPRIL
jgi:hypothetical protein